MNEKPHDTSETAKVRNNAFFKTAYVFIGEHFVCVCEREDWEGAGEARGSECVGVGGWGWVGGRGV